jgi:hypothetical protein
MSVKISELPNITAASLLTVSSAVFPLVANLSSNNTTFQTTIANVKTFMQTGDFNITGGLTAQANSIFYGNLTVDVLIANTQVIGTTTTVSSTSNLIDIQTDANLALPAVDNGKDVGTRLFFNKGTGDVAALVWKNSTQYLTYYGSGVGNANTTLSGNSILGTMQLGQLLVANNTPSFANATGALQVSGGISTGGNVYVGEHVYAANDISAQGTGIFGSIRSNANISAATTLTAAGAVTGQSLASNSFATIHTTLVTGGNATVNGLAVNTSATISSTLGVTGAVTAAGGLQNTPIGNTTASTATFTTVRTGNVIPSTANASTLGNSTTWYSAVYATAVQSFYADLAEKYIADQIYDPGTVVIFGGTEEITTTDKPGDTRVAGVISTDPAYLMNMSSTGLPVALRGKVPVKIVGQVSKGDLLITSEVPGHGASVGFRTDYDSNAVFAKSLVDDRSYDARVIWAVIL